MYVNDEFVARICHEVNRAYCLSNGDDSQPSWEDAPKWQKESALNGIEFHLGNDKTPEESHANWFAEKEKDGWVYGEVKDPEKKEHPCMVPYNQLPAEQKTKDYLFKAVVDTFKKARNEQENEICPITLSAETNSENEKTYLSMELVKIVHGQIDNVLRDQAEKHLIKMFKESKNHELSYMAREIVGLVRGQVVEELNRLASDHLLSLFEDKEIGGE